MSKENVAQEIKVAPDAIYGTGKRKSAIARVWMFSGKGKISINDKTLDAYLGSEVLSNTVVKPLEVLGLASKYDVVIKTKGGGIVSQTGAALLGIARALVALNPEFRLKMRENNFLTRDPRVKERKKYGCKKARKGFQFRKR